MTLFYSNSKSAIINFDLTSDKALYGEWEGKSAEAVSAALRDPIKEKVQRATVYCEYTHSHGNYHRRWIEFDQSGKVVERCFRAAFRRALDHSRATLPRLRPPASRGPAGGMRVRERAGARAWFSNLAGSI